MVLPSLTECAAAVDRLAPALLSIAIRSVVFLGLASLAVLVMRRASAAARHWVWLLGVGGLVVLPMLSIILPGWNILPRPAVSRATVPPVVEAAAFPLAAAPVQNLVRGEESPVHVRSESTAQLHRDSIPAQATVPLHAATVASTNDRSTSLPRSRLAALPSSFWILLVWLVGSLLVLGHVLLGYLSLWSLRRRCTLIDQRDWTELLNRLCARLRIRRNIELLSSTRRTMPMTWGLWRTRLLLPEEAGGWTPQHRSDVLLHELGHVRRWDCVAQLVAQMACAIYWFNPLVWIAWHRMQIERERACDDLVLNAGAKASAYAEHLLHSASSMPVLHFASAAIAMARPSTLEERLKAILDPRRNRRQMSIGGVIGTILLLAAAIVPVAAVRAQPTPPRETATDSGSTPALSPVVAPASRPSGPNRFGSRTGGGSGGFGARALPATPVLGDGPTCALDATIYDVRLPVDTIGQLDVDALTQASGTAAEFEKALAALGTMRPLYRANQSVRLASDSITIGTQTPYVTNSQVTNTGRSVNTVTYSTTGAIFSLAGKTGAAGNIDLDLSIQMSAITEGNTPIAGDVKAALFRTATISHKGPVEARKPFVVLSVDAATLDPNGKAVAYIGRITLQAPSNSATAPAPGN